MEITLVKLAQITNGFLVGDENKIIRNASGLAEAVADDISFLGNMKYLQQAFETKAGALFVGQDIDEKKFSGKNIIKVANPQYAYSLVLNIIAKERLDDIKFEISPRAFIDEQAKVAPDVYIGACVVIDKGAQVASGTRIFPNVYVGRNAKIGKSCIIYSNVTIRENCVLGDRVILQPGVVVGGDGFGFATVDGQNQKIPQIGNVVIGNDVEVGANTTIDRATTNSTKIGDGAKIDNLVQIAHNVCIGKNSLIVAQVGISGSTKIGDNVIVGGQTGIAGHLNIGNNVLVAGQSGVSGNIKDGQKVGGNPIVDLTQSIKIRAALRHLPQIYQDIKNIKKKLEGLEDKECQSKPQ
ncbi:MAG: UDP-3-O-(3-hydroxymyristoyl)glucosamine N-acyltransferase [Elusimicrobiota bacterium]|jgi:UDP-3-O-[3-hydroxymyristoyl] glucosamine N-acyltransferase|nr:UDP-3-O-(3-hydroxymyristoyl)glucosamine N-acyltransferase [Elusimicrobiota bacterium]